jgi:outer membrane protein assembly factor BamB
MATTELPVQFRDTDARINRLVEAAVNHPRPRLLHSLAFMFCLAGIFAAPAAPADGWPTAHGDPANTNNVDVRTAPARQPAATIPLRDIATGVTPVIAPDGTLYIGNERGKLMSFSADGTAGWSRDLGGFQSVTAQAAIGSDGSIYLVGVATIRDHRTDPPATQHVAELHRFTAGGGWLWHVQLAGPVEGMIHSPPNIVRVGDSDVIMIATGQKQGGFETFLTAYSDGGAVLAQEKVTAPLPPVGDVTGGPDWGALWPDFLDFLECVPTLACEFSATVEAPIEQRLPTKLVRPLPALAVFAQTESGLPSVFISDRFHDLVGYSFTGSAFTELMRIHDDDRYLTSAPLVWPNAPVMIGFGGPDADAGTMFVSLSPGYTGGPVTTHRIATPPFVATPTALGNAMFALVEFGGGVTFLNGGNVVKRTSLPGQSIAAAAASRTHVFVSTVTGLFTFNKATMEKSDEFAWTKGGTSQPVIGPQGHVYAIAQDTLYVFPPRRIPDVPVGPLHDITSGNPQPLTPPTGSVLTEPGTTAPLPQIVPADAQPLPEIQPDVPSRTYKPPLTAGGNRLLACLDLDGDDCGNSQQRAIAENFCRSQGFDRAVELDVDSRRGTAETLDGQLCSKKKCKVFDFIVCRK